MDNIDHIQALQNGNMDSLIQQMAQDNPRVQAIMEMMKQQTAEVETQAREESQLIRQNKQLIKALKKAHRQIRQMGDELKAMEESFEFFLQINDELAEAVGACGECWGELDDCQHCQGQGRAGSFMPNEEAFNHYIRPALQHINPPKDNSNGPIHPSKNILKE